MSMVLKLFLSLPHSQVMMLLNNTCHDMDDEEHAKLSVRLMNCQSQAEGRPTFKCTEEMVTYNIIEPQFTTCTSHVYHMSTPT